MIAAFRIALATTTLMLASVSQAPAFRDADALAIMADRYDGQSDIEISGRHGRVGGSNIWYGTICESTSSGRFYLIHATEGRSPDVFEIDGLCYTEVSWRDIDGDGTPEIRAVSQGGGSGIIQTNATFYRWEPSASEPRELVSFLEYRTSSWDGVYGSLGFEPPEWLPFTTERSSFLPVGALCPNEAECALVETGVFCIEDCELPLPADFVAAPGWTAFLAALAERGLEPGNATASAEVPQASAAAQAAFDAWLTE